MFGRVFRKVLTSAVEPQTAALVIPISLWVRAHSRKKTVVTKEWIFLQLKQKVAQRESLFGALWALQMLKTAQPDGACAVRPSLAIQHLPQHINARSQNTSKHH